MDMDNLEDLVRAYCDLNNNFSRSNQIEFMSGVEVPEYIPNRDTGVWVDNFRKIGIGRNPRTQSLINLPYNEILEKLQENTMIEINDPDSGKYHSGYTRNFLRDYINKLYDKYGRQFSMVDSYYAKGYNRVLELISTLPPFKKIKESEDRAIILAVALHPDEKVRKLVTLNRNPIFKDIWSIYMEHSPDLMRKLNSAYRR